jgi:hypothetical protein
MLWDTRTEHVKTRFAVVIFPANNFFVDEIES